MILVNGAQRARPDGLSSRKVTTRDVERREAAARTIVCELNSRKTKIII